VGTVYALGKALGKTVDALLDEQAGADTWPGSDEAQAPPAKRPRKRKGQ
jgi:hypothetical protein